ncbi:GLEYA domain-containing protein [Microdochium trichocladiopsis]|uniref:GLEYA domain-containing protein n=1 Tax=Microdochium trichocladiopsis TaxID=1682393 RepID=A0A9P8XSM7_9PEZI|nr:GLEYA domain-containing protein [Microdochium trichocladiopsis]KAH7014485.1 GLEYA domain-containing protein [Microdochium trichocladiopsis]
MRAISNIVPILLPLAAYAAPAPAVEERGLLDPVVCLLNNLLVGLRNDPLATPYCSSVLGIRPLTASASVAVTVRPTITSTVSIGGGTVTFTVGRQDTTQVTTTATATSTITSTVTSTTSISTVTCLDAAYTASVGRRDAPIDPPALDKRQVSVSASAAVTPTIIPPSAQPGNIQTACSCLGLTTNTITITPTVTAGAGVTNFATVNLGAQVSLTITLNELVTGTTTVTTTVTTTTTSTQGVVGTFLANPDGLRFKKYQHQFSADNNPGAFNVEYFKNTGFDFAGSIRSPRFSSPDWPYGDSSMTMGGQTFDSAFAAVVVQGFYVARATGVHTFSSSGDYVDNWGYLWTGDKSYSAYDSSNTDFKSIRTAGGPYVGGTKQLQMNVGDAIPFTWLWSNGGGVGNSDLTITVPSGGFSGGEGNFVPACSANTFS